VHFLGDTLYGHYCIVVFVGLSQSDYTLYDSKIRLLQIVPLLILI
jgi:hypothetical protein